MHFYKYYLPVPGATNQQGTISYSASASITESGTAKKVGDLTLNTTADFNGDLNEQGVLQGTIAFDTSASLLQQGEKPDTFFTDINLDGEVGVFRTYLPNTQSVTVNGNLTLNASSDIGLDLGAITQQATLSFVGKANYRHVSSEGILPQSITFNSSANVGFTLTTKQLPFQTKFERGEGQIAQVEAGGQFIRKQERS